MPGCHSSRSGMGPSCSARFDLVEVECGRVEPDPTERGSPIQPSRRGPAPATAGRNAITASQPT